MKDFDEFEAAIVALYDGLQAALEGVADERDIGYPEMMCVLSSMLCTAAVDSGMSRAAFMMTLQLNYDHAEEIAQPSDDPVVH